MSLEDKFKKIIADFKKFQELNEDEQISVTRFGRLFELAFLGFTLTDESNLYFPPAEYLSFVDSLDLMKKVQPVGYDPSDPSEGCNHDFFESVQSFLNVGKEELKYYICIGTKMDFWHGVDAVFTWKDVFVTIDLTFDPEKKVRADFRISPDDVDSGKIYKEIARHIALLLVRRQLVKLFGYRISNFRPRCT